MSVHIYHGDIVYAPSADELSVNENSYIVVEAGVIQGIYEIIPDKYKEVPIVDYGRQMIIPAFSDLHVHASQYVQRGVGMDLLLSDWLNHYTFPQEARFKDPEYAKNCYDAFVDDLILQGTFHANTFTTIHREATDYLFERMEKKGLYGLVGKVNMDMQSPDILIETTEASLQETELFLEKHASKDGRVKPILVPRFAPTCSENLMVGLGKLAKKYQVGVHTHLVESKWEASEALRCYPGYSCDAEIYERSGLLEHGPSVFAHVIFPSREDCRILKKYKSVSVHCPDATANIIAGIMPVQALNDEGLRIALGCDIGAAPSPAIYRQIARSIQLSKLKEFYEPNASKTITLTEAFYHATKEGGSVFGKVGSLEPGYHFNALVIDTMEDAWLQMKPEERLERFCYAGDDRHIKARYIDDCLIEV